MKKNIIIVIPTLRMGGAEKSLVSLVKALDANSVNVDLFLFEAGGILQKEIPEWVNIIEADSVTRGMTLELRYYLGEMFRTGHFRAGIARIWIKIRSIFTKRTNFSWKIAKKYIPNLTTQYDVAIGYLEGVTDFFVLDKVQAMKKVGWIHTDYSHKTITAKEIEYYGRFEQLVTISEKCKDAFINLVPNVKSKIVIMENIVLPEEIREKANESTQDRWDDSAEMQIVSVGRLDYQKGMDIAAQAAKILLERGKSFIWHIYGKGIMKEELKKYIIEIGLQNNLILEGVRENPYPYMKKADIIVQPSRVEGKSIVIDEAKILGKAIVVTSYPSVFDQIKNRETGLIVEISPDSIADGIEELVRNTELKAYMEQNAFNEKNSSYKTIEQFYDLLKDANDE